MSGEKPTTRLVTRVCLYYKYHKNKSKVFCEMESQHRFLKSKKPLLTHHKLQSIFPLPQLAARLFFKIGQMIGLNNRPVSFAFITITANWACHVAPLET